jgi:glyoxylase I family protein
MPLQVEGLAPLFQVFDMPASIHFYRDPLGFEVIKTSKPLSEHADDVTWAMLQLNDTIVMLNTAYEPEYRPAVPDPARIAAHADSALYFGCRDVDHAYQQLRELGLNVKEPVVAPYGMKQVNLSDPDGYHLCFQWPA